MTKLTRIILSNDSVSETEANTVFEWLVPVIEEEPAAVEALEVAEDVIKRCVTGEDRLLAHLLDWWYVVTTGQRSVNGLAHRLPNSIDFQVKNHMESVAAIKSKLTPAAWLEKRISLRSELAALKEIVGFDETIRLQGDVEASNWLRGILLEWNETIRHLQQNQPAQAITIDKHGIERVLRDRGVEVGGRRFTKIQKSCEKTVEQINRVVVLQEAVQPWKQGSIPESLSAVPTSLKHAVGEFKAAALLRPILESFVPPSVHKDGVARGLDKAGQTSDLRGRFKLARIVDEWCESTGQVIESLEPELQRYRTIKGAHKELSAKKSISEEELDTLEFLVKTDELEDAEKTLNALREKIYRDEQTQQTRFQLQGLEQKLRESSLREDADWGQLVEKLKEKIESPDLDLTEMARAIGAAHTRLTEELDALMQEQQEDLEKLLINLGPLSSESAMREWYRKRSAIERRDGRGANALKNELELELEKSRKQCRESTEEVLKQIESTLTQERGDFSNEDVISFQNRKLEISEWLRDEKLSDKALAAASQTADELEAEIGERKIARWSPESGEESLVNHILAFCKADLEFDDVDVRRLYVSIKTRPFVILAGLTGSGKSSLSRTFAAAFGATRSNGRFRRVAVRPDWIDQSEVLGFVNVVTNQFVPGWLAEMVRSCEEAPDKLHFVLLDEMNLAPVEQYLAEWLSAVEEWRSGSEEAQIPLYPSSLQIKNVDQWPPALKFPENLFFIGTVNVDETTRPLSERVLDRANVLLLNVSVSDRHHEPNGRALAPMQVGASDWKKICKTTPSDDHHDFLVEIADILRHVNVGVGLRAHLELERFVANAQGIMDDEAALDWGLVQRIIPKIRGFKSHLVDALQELRVEFENVGANQAAAILHRWLADSISDDEFLEGTDPQLALARI